MDVYVGKHVTNFVCGVYMCVCKGVMSVCTFNVCVFPIKQLKLEILHRIAKT